jgi:hypothetical protein
MTRTEREALKAENVAVFFRHGRTVSWKLVQAKNWAKSAPTCPFYRAIRCRRRGSNPRPSAYETPALTI